MVFVLFSQKRLQIVHGDIKLVFFKPRGIGNKRRFVFEFGGMRGFVVAVGRMELTTVIGHYMYIP